MPTPSSAHLQPLPRRRSNARYWLIGGVVLIGLAATTALILPKLMVGQATQAPTDAGTFVTRQVEEVSIQDRMQAALQQPTTVQAGEQPNPNTATENTPAATQDLQPGIPMPEGQTPQESLTTNGQPADPANPQAPTQNAEAPPNAVGEAVREPVNTPAAETTQGTAVQNTPVQQPANGRDFQLRISESEISSLIYSGLVQGTAPQYRESIQGVSTRISGGRASISVALQPRHLPDAFLRNLPGVNRDTPTVYLGGDLSLRREGNSVTPDIHQLRLGNFRLPMPFINAAVKTQVQQYVGQMLQMPDGRRAQLDDIQMDSGAVTLRGHLQ